MTELEEKFMNVFGIEPKIIYYYGVKSYSEKLYPPITDHILLELVCIFNQEYHGYELCSDRINDLRNEILKDWYCCRRIH